jgi:hypothetical protein
MLCLSIAAAFCEQLLESAGERFAGPIAILRNWSYCLFYVMAELWGSVVVSVLFWGFANQVSQQTLIVQHWLFCPAAGLQCMMTYVPMLGTCISNRLVLQSFNSHRDLYNYGIYRGTSI